MSENENQEDYFKELIELLKKLKDDLQVHGRAMDTTGVAPKLFKEFRIIFKQTMMAGDVYFELVTWPKSPELAEEEQRQKDRAKANRILPLTENEYVEALRLERKGLSFAQIAKRLSMNEKEFRRSWIVSVQRYETTQHILDKVAQVPEGEQDYVLKVRTNPYAKPESTFLKLNPVRVLLKQGLKPKEIAERLGLDFDSFKTWLPANEKYLNL